MSRCTVVVIGLLAGGAECFSLPPIHPSARITATASSSSSSSSNINRRAVILHEVVTDSSDTTQDDTVSDPASIVYYDDLLNPDNPTGVVCARGVCVIPDDGGDYDWSAPPGYSSLDDTQQQQKQQPSIVQRFLHSYLGPRLLLAFASVLYGTNFPLGAMMNDSLPPSAATSARMILASVALSPFLFKLEGKLAPSALLCGCFTALGYITQSLSLVDTSPAKVAFLGKRHY